MTDRRLNSRRPYGGVIHTIQHAIWAVAALAALSGTAWAETYETYIGAFGDWNAFHDGAGAAKVCYMESLPKKSEGNYTARGKTYVMVTHQPANQVVGQVYVTAGYTYKPSSEAEVLIGETRYPLFTHRDTPDTAWAFDDRALRQAMIKGRTMVIMGTSSRGTLTTDIYSLSGVQAAYRAISQECGLR
jgi:hypothetical protein